LSGASLPERLLPENEGNPKGYWEPLDAMNLNDDFLFRHGSTWYDPTLRLQDDALFDLHERQNYIKDILSFFTACPPERLLVIKEPRITALSDFWFEAARFAGLSVRIVIPVRHPGEVAASLAARDGLSPELSDALWLKYNLLAENRSRGLPRVFVDYSRLLGNWREEIARISAALSVDLSTSNEAAIDAFLDADSNHQKRSSAPEDVFGQSWIGRVYAEISGAARDVPPDLAAMDEIFSAYRASERAFRTSLDEFRTRFGPPSDAATKSPDDISNGSAYGRASER